MASRDAGTAILMQCPHCGINVLSVVRTCPHCGLIFAKWRALRVRRLEAAILRNSGAHKLGIGLVEYHIYIPSLKQVVMAACLLAAGLRFNSGKDVVMVESQFNGVPVFAAQNVRVAFNKPILPLGLALKSDFLGQVSRDPFSPRILINMDTLRGQVEATVGKRRKWELNERFFHDRSYYWSPSLQALSKTFSGIPSHRLKKEVGREYLRAVMLHECRHIQDEFWKHPSHENETRAYLAQLVDSPLGLAWVEMRPFREPSETRGEPHEVAYYRIWKGLIEFPDMDGDWRKIYNMSPHELSARARILYERWYGPLAPPDQACLESLEFEDVARRLL